MAIRQGLCAVLASIGILLGGTAVTAFAQPPGTQLRGIVAAVADGSVSLGDGSSFPVNSDTRVTELWPATVANLAPGMFVAISASRIADGTLQASVVSAFPESARVPEGQREMIETSFCQPGCQPGDLMTNAAIDDARLDSVDGGTMTITYLDQSSQVRITPDTRIEIQAPGTLNDVAPGDQVIGFVSPQGIASTVWVFMQ